MYLYIQVLGDEAALFLKKTNIQPSLEYIYWKEENITVYPHIHVTVYPQIKNEIKSLTMTKTRDAVMFTVNVFNS